MLNTQNTETISRWTTNFSSLHKFMQESTHTLRCSYLGLNYCSQDQVHS